MVVHRARRWALCCFAACRWVALEVRGSADQAARPQRGGPQSQRVSSSWAGSAVRQEVGGLKQWLLTQGGPSSARGRAPSQRRLNGVLNSAFCRRLAHREAAAAQAGDCRRGGHRRLCPCGEAAGRCVQLSVWCACLTARLCARSARPLDLALMCGSCCSLLLPPAAAAAVSANSSSCCCLSLHHPACWLLRCLRLDLRLLLPLPTKQGADAEGRTPLELIREGQVVRGTVVAQLLYHGAQVGRALCLCASAMPAGVQALHAALHAGLQESARTALPADWHASAAQLPSCQAPRWRQLRRHWLNRSPTPPANLPTCPPPTDRHWRAVGRPAALLRGSVGGGGAIPAARRRGG